MTRPKSDNLFVGHHLAAAPLPARVDIGVAAQSSPHGFDPLGLDGGHGAGKETRGLHHLGGHDPGPGAVEEPRAGKDHHFAPPGGLVDVLVPALGDVAQKSCQDGLVDGRLQVRALVGMAGGCVHMAVGLQFGQHGVELAVDVAPFAQPAVGKKLALGPALETPGTALGGQSALVGLPDVD